MGRLLAATDNRLPVLRLGQHALVQSGLLAVVFFLLFLPLLALADDDEGATVPVRMPETVAVIKSHPVVVDGRKLFLVRGTNSYPSDKRAEAISERIYQAAANTALGPDQAVVVDEQGISSIYFGKLRVMTVLDADIRFEDVQREALAVAYRDRIRHAITDYREQRTRQYLMDSMLHVLVVTALLVFFYFVLRWLTRKAVAYVEHVAKENIEKLEARTFKLVRAQQLWKIVVSSLKLAKWALVLIVVDAYLGYTLGLFPWTRSFSDILFSTILVPLEHMVVKTTEALPGLVFIVLLVIVLRYFLGMIKLFFAGVADGTISWKDAEPDWAFPTYRIVRMFVIVFGVVMAYPYIPGSSSEAFKGLSLLLGLLVSLGATSIIGNIIAGYSLIYRRAFKVGDLVKVEEHTGEVIEIAALVTHLKTVKNEIVVVPNSEILNSNIVNYSTLRKQGLVLHTEVGIGYETPWRQVEAMLKMAADRTPGLLKEPPPFVLQKSLNDFCVVYEINARTDKPGDMPLLYSRLHQNILDVFNEYGVQIMTPAYERDTAEPKLVPRERWFEAPAKAPPETGAG